MSSTATSGRWVVITASASRPSAASATTSTPGIDASSARNPARTSAWSSARTTSDGRRRERHARTARGTATGNRPSPGFRRRRPRGSLEIAPDQRRALGHAGNPQVTAGSRRVGSKPTPSSVTISTSTPDRPSKPQADGRGAGAGVAHDVGDRLLGDPEAGRLHLGWEPLAADGHAAGDRRHRSGATTRRQSARSAGGQARGRRGRTAAGRRRPCGPGPSAASTAARLSLISAPLAPVRALTTVQPHQAEANRRQRLADDVMELTCDLRPFGFLGGDHPDLDGSLDVGSPLVRPLVRCRRTPGEKSPSAPRATHTSPFPTPVVHGRCGRPTPVSCTPCRRRPDHRSESAFPGLQVAQGWRGLDTASIVGFDHSRGPSAVRTWSSGTPRRSRDERLGEGNVQGRVGPGRRGRPGRLADRAPVCPAGGPGRGGHRPRRRDDRPGRGP